MDEVKDESLNREIDDIRKWVILFSTTKVVAKVQWNLMAKIIFFNKSKINAGVGKSRFTVGYAK